MDLLSNLPDEVRCHILSFLTTKEAALTSVLSKKWRNLFALVPNLDVDDSEFLHPEEGKRERDGILESFMGFVDMVLALQGNSPIHKFSLKCKDGVCEARLNRWICQVLQRGVSNLDLSIDIRDAYLPQEMFVSKTLVNLKLASACGIHWWTGAEGTCLPVLKSLCVLSGRIFCDDKLQVMLPACFPVLEDLRMANMEWIDSDETVSSATLTNLLISGFPPENLKSISFDAPNLISLFYSDFVAEDYPLVNMKNLSQARIVLRANDDQIKRLRGPNNVLLEDDVVHHFGNVVKLMNGIQNVRELHLCPDTLEVLSLCCESLPVFNNVKTLGIYSEEVRGWQAVPALLRNCPHLEILTFEGLVHYVTDKCGDACSCIYRKDKGSSLTTSPVKVVKVRGFGVTMKELHMVEHFLDYFPCLKEMNLYIEEHTLTQLGKNPQVSEILEMIEEYKELYSCKVRLYVSHTLTTQSPFGI
ncbi:PREDICTED: F-box protein At3g03040-like [Camelina sativa]|uniref:F-box protein At3g03040-like n=1 Tax=Camelina sativa TaxID=90675 RepID=A0ABM0SX39_CAMSA|nr:PREDICTED: F-box protein At3g03040-like [Camelina sativa]